MIKVGFTGTRAGMTRLQGNAVRTLLSALRELSTGQPFFEHGDCVGADFEAHHMAVTLRYYTVAHPPTNERYRAFTNCNVYRRARPYLERNKNIVWDTHLLIATPKQFHEQTRGGTWHTIQYARQKQHSLIHIIQPDGVIKTELGS